MTVAGDLVCVTCDHWFDLGRAVGPSGLPYVERYVFARGKALDNWTSEEVNTSLWKFVAEHRDHDLEIVLDSSERHAELMSRDGEYLYVGDVPSFSEYLEGWTGR
ncbi:hypothetical protein HDA40_007944 [Hamadaea flava]|uniref:Uncharacterized protein n=1 Tax=Hamadaea flava TaxID=1742688 RepID=A0ABV8LXI0_9ACTN|nr:hypothetical protein [Hamadaea flava]MCP2329437.1 hypothetical protein [Hamadaea flava]